MKILGILIIYQSKPDSMGNSSYAFLYVDTTTGKRVEAQTGGGENNILCSRFYIRPEFDYYKTGNSESCFYIQKQMNFRDMKELPYAGCNSKDIADYINKKLLESV